MTLILLAAALCLPPAVALQSEAPRASFSIPSLAAPTVTEAATPNLMPMPGPNVAPSLPAAPQAPAPAASPNTELAVLAGQGPQQPGGGAENLRQRLYDGERVYAPDAAYQTLDDKTANDLDLFTADSGLYAVINQGELQPLEKGSKISVRGTRTATAFGSKRLQWVLAHPSQDLEEIRRRQQAAAELAQNAPLRQALDQATQAMGPAAREPLWQHFLFDLPGSSAKGRVIAVHFLQVILTGAVAALLWHGGARALLQVVVMFLMLAGNPYSQIVKARKQLLPYKSVFAFSRAAAKPLSQSASPMLRELSRALDVDNASADGPGLSGLSGSFKRMRGLAFMTIPDFLWFHGAKTLPYLESRLRAKQAQLSKLLGAVGELDALRALSAYGEGLGARGTKPVFKEGTAPSLSITDGHHPFLIAQGASVGNDVRLDLSLDASAGGKDFGVLTGSNMGGKSTYLRMAALLPVLAQTGTLVPAAAYESTLLKIVSSIDIRDHLASGKSLYDSETDRILGLINEAAKGGYLMVMDEILQGTNPEESSAAQWAVVRHLIKTNNLFFLATHNPKVTELSELEPRLTNLHVEENLVDGKMTFSHKILPGPATSRNGLLTLEQKSFPPDVVEEARRVLEAAKKPGA